MSPPKVDLSIWLPFFLFSFLFFLAGREQCKFLGTSFFISQLSRSLLPLLLQFSLCVCVCVDRLRDFFFLAFLSQESLFFSSRDKLHPVYCIAIHNSSAAAATKQTEPNRTKLYKVARASKSRTRWAPRYTAKCVCMFGSIVRTLNGWTEDDDQDDDDDEEVEKEGKGTRNWAGCCPRKAAVVVVDGVLFCFLPLFCLESEYVCVQTLKTSLRLIHWTLSTLWLRLLQFFYSLHIQLVFGFFIHTNKLFYVILFYFGVWQQWCTH